jgi:hypothetical protein
MISTFGSRVGLAFVAIFAAAALCAAPACAQATAPAAASATAGTKPAESAASAPADQPAAEEAWPPGALMKMLEPSGARKALEELNLRFYGYAQTGFTGRLTGGQDPLPFRAFDARRPNNLRLNQISITGERWYDSNKSFDFGAKVQGLFGGDAMLTRSPGLFDHAGQGDGECWADLFQAYVTGWIRTGEASGLEVLAGKFATPMGYEATEGALAPMYSHSFLFGVLPFTHTGVKLTYTFDPQWSAYVAVVEGWDVFNDNNEAPSYMAGGTWKSRETVGVNPKHLISACFMTGPEQDNDSRHFRTAMDAYYTRWWTPRLSQTINVGLGFGMEELPTDMAVASGFGFDPFDTTDFNHDHWYGVAHYLSYACCDRVTATWRAEWFRDEHGFWTGFGGNLFENTLGLSITPWPDHPCLKNLTFRPEIRWDYSCDPVFGDDRRSQLTAAMDVIFKF